MAAKRRYKRKGKKLPLSAVIIVILAALAALAAGYFGKKEPVQVPENTKDLMVHFIDVGQGDATLIASPDGDTLLIDAGPGSSEDELIAYLDEIGIETIDYFVLTHPDEDHIGGADLVFSEYTVGSVILPDCEKDTKAYENLENAISAEEGCIRRQAAAGSEFTFCQGGTVTVLAPVSQEYDDVNDYSVVLRLDYYATSFLFAGDAQKTSEYEMIEEWTGGELDCDVLKVGHHGSTTSSTVAFLNSVTPDLAVISCGEDNKYGHPHNEIIDRFEKEEITVYRTDTEGTVCLVSNGKEVSRFGKTP